MGLAVGIIGLPNVGKSTLFKALTKNNVLVANYPFATIDPNTGVVPVPDARLDKLEEIFKPEKVIPATVTFVDIAGLVAGAHRGEGLGNKFLAHIREVNAVVHLVRTFKNTEVTHIEGMGLPQKDIDTINTELILADLQTLDSYLPKVRKQAKAEPKLQLGVDLLEKIRDYLDKGKLPAKTEAEKWKLEASKDQAPDIQGLISNLLTVKPQIYVFNVDEITIKDRAEQKQLTKLVDPDPAVFICAKLEAELAGLDPKDSQELLKEVGLDKSGLERLATVAYRTLGLQTFFTGGPKEVRAWTINIGSKAPEAAGVIHTDFARGFIAADVVSYEDLIASGSLANAKAAGKLRSEGKDYTVRDGDVIEFKFNV